MIESSSSTARLETGPRFDARWLAVWSRAPFNASGGLVPVGIAGTGGGARGRLAVVAPEAAPHPAVASDGRTTVLVAGDLYNRGDLRELAAVAAPLEDDAALLLAAYRRLGADLVGRLRGVFCFVVWDEERELLLAVRDQLGLHPLFYSLVGDDVLLSSSIDLLTAQPAVTPRLNRAAIADFLRQRWLVKEETVYERVLRVPPGHLLRVDRGGARLVRYWNPELPTAGHGWNEEEETERFEFLFDQAVQRGFARGPVGIYLSGGLDSVSVAAIAADDSPAAGLPPPVALSLAFPDPQCNEEDSQRQIAKSLGLPHVIVDLDDTVRPQGLIQRALDLSATRDVPLVNLWSPAYHYLAREARRLGCRTILTGSGGDEWLCVSPLYGADLVRKGDLAGLYRLWRVTQRSHRMTPGQSLRAAIWTFGLRPMVGIAARRGLARLAPGLLAARMRRVSAMREWLAPDAALRRQLEERSQLYFDQLYDGSVSYYEYECRRALDHPLVAVEYEEWFEDSRLLGVGIHHPFLDVELSEFLFRAQPEVLNRGDRSKGLVRYTLDRRFPQLGFEAHKKVSAVDYFTQIALAQVPEAWSRMGGIRVLGELGIVDAAQIGANGEAIVASTPVRRAALLWDMLNLEAWVRTHVV